MMKKLFTLLLALTATLTAWSNGTNIDGIYYLLAGDTATVTYMGSNYYSNSYSGSVTIPSSVTYSGATYRVTSIGSEAFYQCPGLTSITIPNSVTSIGSYAFNGCIGLTSVTIPSSVTSIGGFAFYCCTGLTSITIPNSVTSIGDWTFNGCRGLTSVTIPSSVTSIGGGAFSNCSGLTSITIPNSVTSIGWSAFEYCTGLTSITIPNSVTSIDNDAFRGCTSLTSITCYATTPPTCDYNCFYNVDKSIPLYVPAASVAIYQAANRWKEFTNIQPIAGDSATMPNNNVITTPGSTDVTITWPTDSSADTYTITITKNGETVCILTFDAQGQLTNIAFAPARGASQGNQATQTVNGYQFTVTGLEAGTSYNYTVTTSANGTTLSTQSGSFTTKTTALTDIQAPNTAADGKYFLGGHLYIQKAGHLYTPAGHQLK